jgi:hypothetical protein
MWLMTITSEMALNFNTGLINRGGSPFAQFRKVYPDCPVNKKKAMEWASKKLYDLGVTPTGYFTRTMNAILSGEGKLSLAK